MKTTCCSQCGAPFANEAKFCEQCGAARSTAATVPAPLAMPPPESAAAAPLAPPALQTSDLEWQSDMKLLNNRFFLGDLAKWTVLTTIACGVFFMLLFGLAGNGNGVQVALVFMTIPPVLIFLGTLIFALIMGNRLPMAFRVDSNGIHMKSLSKRVKNINRTAMVVGVLAGKPGMVGAGAIGASQERTSIVWHELHRVRFHPDQRVIFVKGGILSRLRVYCTPQNYKAVEQTILNNLPSDAYVTTA